MSNQIHISLAITDQVSRIRIRIKLRSKKDIFDFLTKRFKRNLIIVYQFGELLPPARYDNCPTNFLIEILADRKRLISMS